MKCLTDDEILTWLKNQSVTGKPYGRADSPTHYVQFRCPASLVQISLFIRAAIDVISPADELLVHITDWAHYQPHELLAINSLRRSIGDGRELIDAPGVLVDRANLDFAVSIFGLAAAYRWDGYLYFPNDVLHFLKKSYSGLVLEEIAVE